MKTKININHIRDNFTEVTIKGVHFYYSYDTLVAIATDEVELRTSTHWSRTTERHMNQAGIGHWDEIPQDRLEKLAEELV